MIEDKVSTEQGKPQALLPMPISEMAKIAGDPSTLAHIWSLAINIGIGIGRMQAEMRFNKMLRERRN